MNRPPLPLEGIRVIAITLVWAGPYAAQNLADWGAEVIKVEPLSVLQPQTRGFSTHLTKEDVVKRKSWGVAYPDWDPGTRLWNRSPHFNVHARNQLSVTIELRTPEGKEAFDKLIAVSDVLIENNVPETATKLGLQYERLSKINPGLVMVRMPGFGIDAPYSSYRGLGSHSDGISGHTWIRGYEDLDVQVREDVYYSDSASGVMGAVAAMMGLRHRARTGRGQMIEMPLIENFTAYMGDSIMDYTMNRRSQRTLGNRHRHLAPHGCYPCKGDDNWMVIAVSNEDEWQSLRHAMGDPDWVQDDKFATESSRYRNQVDLDRHIAEWTKTVDKQEASHLLQSRGIAASAVHNQREVYENPHYKEREFFHEVTQAETGTHLYPGMNGHLARTPNAIRLPPARLGEHNEYVYKEVLGYSDADYKRLEELGQIGMDYPDHLA